MRSRCGIGARLALRSCLFAVPLLGGCAAGGFSLDKAEIDQSIVTGKVEAAPTESQKMDEATIRNAVSSADVETLKGASVPWANTETGSRGAINSLVEETDAGARCRKFTTSRESFEGVALYKGQVCMVAPGAWRMQDFGAL